MNFRTSDKKTQAYFKKAGVSCTIENVKTAWNRSAIRVVSTGEHDQNTIIFIHGAPGSGDAFYSYLKDSTLLSHARLITYDRPGYGYSGYGNAMTSIEEQTRIVVAIIKRYKLKSVILAGHSYGGPIAAYAPLFSESVRGALLLAPAMDPEHEKYFWIGNLARWTLTRWLVPGSWKVAADEKYTHEAELRNLKDKWEQVRVPIVVVQGNEDRLAPYENLAFCEQRFHPDYFTGITLKNEDHFIPWIREELVVVELMNLSSTIRKLYQE